MSPAFTRMPAAAHHDPSNKQVVYSRKRRVVPVRSDYAF